MILKSYYCLIWNGKKIVPMSYQIYLWKHNGQDDTKNPISNESTSPHADYQTVKQRTTFDV